MSHNNGNWDKPAFPSLWTDPIPDGAEEALEAKLREAHERDKKLQAWARDERGLLALLVECLEGRDLGETLGSIKVYDSGGKCLGYLCDVLDGLKRRLSQ